MYPLFKRTLSPFLALLVLCLCTGCGVNKTSVAMFSGSGALQTPADFTIKLAGLTTYTDKEDPSMKIPVGQLLREELEKELNKTEQFSANKDTGHKYVLGVEIRVYEPITSSATPFSTGSQKYARIGCRVTVYETVKNNNGELVMGKKLFAFHVSKDTAQDERKQLIKSSSLIGGVIGAFTEYTDWEKVIGYCAYDIVRILENTYIK